MPFLDCLKVALQAGYYGEYGGPVADYMSGDVMTVEIDELDPYAVGPFERETMQVLTGLSLQRAAWEHGRLLRWIENRQTASDLRAAKRAEREEGGRRLGGRGGFRKTRRAFRPAFSQDPRLQFGREGREVEQDAGHGSQDRRDVDVSAGRTG